MSECPMCPHPPGAWLRASLCAAMLLPLLASGCAHYKQTQYFEVVGPPNSDGMSSRNFYRMTVSGDGFALRDYKMNAAYLSTATVDTLQGKTPDLGVIERAKQNEKKFDAIKDNLLTALENRSKSSLNAAPTTTSEHEDVIMDISRQLWYSSLSDADLASIGQLQTSDPHAFRKLTFWADGKTIDLNLEQVGKHIDNVIASATSLAQSFKEKRAEEDAARKQRDEQNKSVIKNVIDASSLTEDQKKMFRAIFGLTQPTTPTGGE